MCAEEDELALAMNRSEEGNHKINQSEVVGLEGEDSLFFGQLQQEASQKSGPVAGGGWE